MSDDRRFPRLVSLACHDLRTPLATVHGFATTLKRVELDDPASRYVEMIGAASAQLAELLEELSLVARIEAGTYEPPLTEINSLELALEAAAELDAGAVTVTGEGASVQVEPEATRRALRQLFRAARRHGGLESVDVRVRGPELEVSPITPGAAPIVTGEQLQELGVAAAVGVIEALRGTIRLAGATLSVRLPANEGGVSG